MTHMKSVRGASKKWQCQTRMSECPTRVRLHDRNVRASCYWIW